MRPRYRRIAKTMKKRLPPQNPENGVVRTKRITIVESRRPPKTHFRRITKREMKAVVAAFGVLGRAAEEASFRREIQIPQPLLGEHLVALVERSGNRTIRGIINEIFGRGKLTRIMKKYIEEYRSDPTADAKQVLRDYFGSKQWGNDVIAIARAYVRGH